MSRNTDYISNTMSLRDPLKQSLELFESLLSDADLIGDSVLETKENILKENNTLFEEFEKKFPSICFSIATGI